MTVFYVAHKFTKFNVVNGKHEFTEIAVGVPYETRKKAEKELHRIHKLRGYPLETLVIRERSHG